MVGGCPIFLCLSFSKWEWFSTNNLRKSLTFFENCASKIWQTWRHALKLRSNFKARRFNPPKPKNPNENDSHLARRFYRKKYILSRLFEKINFDIACIGLIFCYYICMEIFKKQKFIYTKYEAEHIINLETAKVPYEIREEIAFIEMLKKGYLSVSVVGELIVVFGLIWVFFIN